MDQQLRDLLVARACAGCVRVTIRDKPYLIRQPSREDRYRAEEAYAEARERAQNEGLLDGQSLLDFLHARGVWSLRDEQVELPKARANLEKLKADLYESRAHTGRRDLARRAIRVTKGYLAGLLARRHGHDHHACAGVAAAARARYLIGAGLYHDGGPKVWNGDAFWHDPTPLLDAAVEAYARARLDEAQVRELARTEPWRGVWGGGRDAVAVFGEPACNLTEEQKGLLVWSKLYDSIREHPEAPADHVYEDDDMLDGWLIVQNRKRAGAGVKPEDVIKNKKILDSGEVYVNTNPHDGAAVADPEVVESFNDAKAASLKKKRLAFVAQQGTVQEAQFPDVMEKLQVEYNRLLAQHAKGKG